MEFNRLRGCCVIASAVTAAVSGLAPAAVGPNVTLTTVSSTGYAISDTNSCAIARNNIVTYGGYQYVAYYGSAAGSTSSSSQYIYVARRSLSGGSWQSRQLTSTTNSNQYLISSSDLSDDHDVLAMGIDGNGYMHLSWGMHNVPLNLATSLSPVNAGWNTSAVNFTKLVDSSNNAYVTGLNESEVTYPEFVNVPGSSDLLLFYRQGGTGGGSGNGNEYIDRYNATTKTWSQVSTPYIQGISTDASAGYNGYLNSITRDSKGNLITTWTWRESSDFQTNHDILYAKSADNGVTWTTQSGTAYTAAITKANAQVIKAIGQGNSLINQSNMTVDANDNPILATWYAPKTSSGNYARQYMLEYYDGTSWKESQISSFGIDTTKTTNTNSDIRALSRPIVLVDSSNRVIVVYRDSTDNGNGLTAAYSTDRVNWNYVALSTDNLGLYEPTYDRTLWQQQGILDLFYQPSGLGAVSAPVQVLEWNAAAYFASVPEPTGLAMLGLGAVGLLRRRART